MNSMEMAINTEIESKRFYLERADRVKDSRLKSFFNTLAEEESLHLRILKNKLEGQPFDLVDKSNEIDSFFEGIEEFESASRTVPDVYNIYISAMENEKKSIGLYKDLISQAFQEDEKRVYEFLLKQDEGHSKLLESLADIVKNGLR